LAAQVYLVQSAYPSVSFTILSPPEVKRHISTSLPAGTGLAQMICGLLKNLVVENLQETMHEASLLSEFVIITLATSAPGRMMQLKGTGSAEAGAESEAASNVKRGREGRNRMKIAKTISPPPFAVRR
jgi:hypothetical protein